MRFWLLPCVLLVLAACRDGGADPDPQRQAKKPAVATRVERLDSTTVSGGVPAPPDTAGVPVQDWTFPGEGTYPFVLPMHSNNFDLLAKRVRFDSNAMQQLRSAQQLALPGSCSEWASDSIYFQMDFGHAAPLVHTYRITWGQYDDRWHNPILCALIAPAGESRVYLFTQRAKAFPTDPVRPGSVLLLHTREGNRYWGLGRSCRMLAPGELQVETECWEYTPGHPKGDHFRVLHRVAITDSGLLRSAAVRSIRVPG